MSVIVENLVIHKGEDFLKTFTITNPDKSLIDISDASAEAFMAKFPEAVEKFSFTVGIITATSQIQISLASSITQNLTSGRNYYNLFIERNNTIKKEREGEILVKDSVLLSPTP